MPPAALHSAARPPSAATPLAPDMPSAVIPPEATPPVVMPPVATWPIAAPPAHCRVATPPAALPSGLLAPVMMPAAATLATALAAGDLNILFLAATRPSRCQATADSHDNCNAVAANGAGAGLVVGRGEYGTYVSF